jgi:hypothetical protein
MRDNGIQQGKEDGIRIKIRIRRAGEHGKWVRGGKKGEIWGR